MHDKHPEQTETSRNNCPTRRMLRLPEVIGRVGLKRSSVYAGVRKGTFPKPHKIGPRASAWDSEDIDRWQAERIAGQA
ncbi:MAG: AlpA family transcriptional regulator [Rhodocyclaceae bacterium]|nr:AlpA family transcriptional regulator [Rhodocyclaceae bacterium]